MRRQVSSIPMLIAETVLQAGLAAHLAQHCSRLCRVGTSSARRAAGGAGLHPRRKILSTNIEGQQRLRKGCC